MLFYFHWSIKIVKCYEFVNLHVYGSCVYENVICIEYKLLLGHKKDDIVCKSGPVVQNFAMIYVDNSIINLMFCVQIYIVIFDINHDKFLCNRARSLQKKC